MPSFLWILAGGTEASNKLAECVSAPVCVTYQRDDASPGSHPLFAGRLGYKGSKAAMDLVKKADVVLALAHVQSLPTLPATASGSRM